MAERVGRGGGGYGGGRAATSLAGMEVSGETEIVKVSASDAAELPAGCGRFGALKVRRQVHPVAFRRRDYWDEPFVLKVVREAAVALHDSDFLDDWRLAEEAIERQLDGWPLLHPGVRRFCAHAVEMYLQAHDVLAAETGPLRFDGYDPETGGPRDNRRLTVFAPVYSDGQGLFEVRRMRFGSARRDDGDAWAPVAAQVLAARASRVRVVEVGLKDGSTTVVFDGTAQEARTAYTGAPRAAVTGVVAGSSVEPGRQCGGCKAAGCCDGPVPLAGHLGQAAPGLKTRSVSASDLETYRTCPAQWYLRQSNVPLEWDEGPASNRGRLVHRWLRTAHARGVACSPGDLPPPGPGAGGVGGLADDEYAIAHPYLAGHLADCPVGPGVTVVLLDEPLYGYDMDADVVVAARPDLMFLDADGVPVLRETKTTDAALPQDEPDAWDRWFQVPWNIGLLASGAVARLGSGEPAVLEVEVLTPLGSRTYTWRLDEPGVVAMAQAEVAHRADAWHVDRTWAATPGKQCGWCPARRWCPDAADPDATPTGPAPVDTPSTAAAPQGWDTDDEPPF